MHSIAASFDIDLLSGTPSTPDDERMPLPITVQWQPWQVMRTAAEETADLAAQVAAIDTMVRNGVLASETALRLLPEKWFGPVEDRDAPLDSLLGDALGEDGMLPPAGLM